MSNFTRILTELHDVKGPGTKVVKFWTNPKTGNTIELLRDREGMYWIAYDDGTFDKNTNVANRGKAGPMVKDEALERFKDIVAEEKHFNKGR